MAKRVSLNFGPLVLTGFIFLVGCAGPTTPFGAISIKHLVHLPWDDSTTDDDDTNDDTEVAKKSSTAAKLVAEAPTAPQQVVVLGGVAQNSPEAQQPLTNAATNPATVRVITSAEAEGPPANVPTVGTGTTSASASTSTSTSISVPVPVPVPPSAQGNGGNVTMRGPLVNREVANSRALASVANPVPSGIHYARPKISFTPKRQVLHAGVTFEIIFEDPRGISKDYEVMLLYNGIDMTSKFMMQADETWEGRPPTKLKLSFDHLRMLPDRDNKVEVVYWHSHNDRPVYGSFMPPHCSAFKPLQVATTGDFEVPTKLIDTITSTATESRFNPTYVAGLIAQESAFNDKAVSYAKALGLTQVTGSGEAQIIKGNDDWPRYPNLNKLPAPLLKMKVLAGKINGQNEWRLNPSLSIKGGVNYISYLNEYWRKPVNYGLVTNNFRDVDLAISQLILASYNSGPSRVNSALQSHGKRWLRDDDELNEARKYVRRVMSFCDYFSRQEEDTDAGSP